MSNLDDIDSSRHTSDNQLSAHNMIFGKIKVIDCVSAIRDQIKILQPSVFKTQLLKFIKTRGFFHLGMTVQNFIKLVFWFYRRKETDVADFYRFITEYVRITTGTNCLNFGYWKEDKDLIQAQKNLSRITGQFAELNTAKNVIDLGSGLLEPAIDWISQYKSMHEIICLDVNYQGLRIAINNITRLTFNNEPGIHDNAKVPSTVNATATHMPFSNEFAERIVALESAQHFKPFAQFVAESYRVLKSQGLLILAIPVLTLNEKRRPKRIKSKFLIKLITLGILSLTWASEHYELTNIRAILLKDNFKIRDVEFIGPSVYGPLADYYSQNRKIFRKILTDKYRSYWQKILLYLVERMVYHSALKMKSSSKKGNIDYVLIKAER